MRRTAAPGTTWRKVLGIALVLVLAGCSGVPSSGDVTVVSQAVAQPNANNVVAPAPGLPPDSIVRDFLSASGQRAAGSGANLSAATQYLTPEAQKRWPVSKYSVVILQNNPRVDLEPGDASQVTVRGNVFGRLDAGGSFTEGSGATDTTYTNTFHVSKVSGQWRISDPPDQLVISQRDFQTSYSLRLLYFLDANGTVVVPDPRYLNVPSESMPGKLVDLLIDGPDGGVAGVAGNRLAGAELHSSVRLDPKVGATLVDLTGVTLPSAASRRALAAQIVYTLTRQDAVQVQIKVGGDLLDADQPLYTSSALQSFDPDRIPAVGQVASDPYYIDSRGEIVGLSNNQPMWGQFGDSSLLVQSAAMSAATGSVAAVVTDGGGYDLVIGQPLNRQEPRAVLTGDALTQPSFSRSGDEVWVVQNGATKPNIYQISATLSAGEVASRVTVQVDLSQAKGAVQALQVSPDGVRVAMIINNLLYLGAVQYADREDAAGGASPSSGAPTPSTTPVPSSTKNTAVIKDLHRVGLNLSDFAAVTFSSSIELMVAAKTANSGIRTVTRLRIDGSDSPAVTADQLTNDVTAIAVHPDGPTAGMYIGFGDRVYQLSGTVSDGRWIPPSVTTQPVLEGTGPFYPS